VDIGDGDNALDLFIASLSWHQFSVKLTLRQFRVPARAEPAPHAC
jgi:hypothetical protein